LPHVVGCSVPNDWGIGVTLSGWVCEELFLDYLKNIFYPHLKKEKITFSVLLFVGHSSHETIQISNLCTELQTHTHLLLPKFNTNSTASGCCSV